MPEIFFPARERCKKCRRKLSAIVLNGLYCSYLCAEHPNPPAKVLEAPRGCRRQVGEVWDWKVKYRFEAEVPLKLRNDPGTNVYRCDSCLFLHVGHSRVQPEHAEKLRRTVADPSTLGSVLQRRREQLNWEKKTLAKVLKVPAIRITEIERGDAQINSMVLFKLLQYLKVTVELIER